MMAVELKLVGFVVVVLLNMGAGHVAALGMTIRQFLHSDRRRVSLTTDLSYEIFGIISVSHVRRIFGIVLIQNDDSESLGMSSQPDERFQCCGELWVAI